VYFMDVFLCFQIQKSFWETFQIPHLTNGGRFVEI
jgi:hypothetical protein